MKTWATGFAAHLAQLVHLWHLNIPIMDEQKDNANLHADCVSVELLQWLRSHK